MGKIDLVGHRFDYLTVEEDVGRTRHGWVVWRCRCDCGNERIIIAPKLKDGFFKSCGCHRRSFTGERICGPDSPYWQGHGEISASFWTAVKGNKNRRGGKVLDFNITIEYAWDKFLEQGRSCALSGRELFFPKTRDDLLHGRKTASLDRINSKLGYVEGNIQWIHKDIQCIKWDIEQTELLYRVKNIIENKDDYRKNAYDVKIILPKKRGKWNGVGNISGSLFSKIRLSASARNIEFNVSMEYLWELFKDQKGCCRLSGENIYLLNRPDMNMNRNASLDRIDSAQPYIEGNVQWLHQTINLMKSDHTLEDFILACKEIYKFKELKHL